MRIILLCLAVVIALPAAAEQVVAGLSRDEVAITANFDGSDILIYGAVKRDREPDQSEPLHVIITVAGPSEPVTVRKKDKRYGIWVNTEAAEVDLAPSFYAVATTAPLQEILSFTEDLRHHVSIPKAIRAVGVTDMVQHPRDFTNALIRIRTNANLYQYLNAAIDLRDDTLFSTQIDLPANLVEGPYRTSIFLTRGGTVVDRFDTVIDVNKVGLERWIYDLAHNQPLIYGILSLTIAIAAGWGASAIFRVIRI